jgi:hypothetical protein
MKFVICMLYDGQSGSKLIKIFAIEWCIFKFNSLIWQFLSFFHVEFSDLSSLEPLPSFWILLLAHICSLLCTTYLITPLLPLVCCLSMPPKRESLQSVKSRLVREQKARTHRRIRELLPRQTRDDIEVTDDSEEENRLIGRRARQKSNQASKTDSSYSACCCGVFVGVLLVVVCLLFGLVIVRRHGGQRMDG